MRISFFERKQNVQKEQKEEKRIKKYFQILLLIFTVTFLTVTLTIDKITEGIERKNLNSQDYVSVFNETDFKKTLFYSHNSDKEKWEKLKKN